MTQQAPSLVIFPRGQLSAKDRRALKAAGVLVVEADDPRAVVTLAPVRPLPAGEILAIAVEAIAQTVHDEPKRTFVAKLAKTLRAALEAARDPHADPDPGRMPTPGPQENHE